MPVPVLLRYIIRNVGPGDVWSVLWMRIVAGQLLIQQRQLYSVVQFGQGIFWAVQNPEPQSLGSVIAIAELLQSSVGIRHDAEWAYSVGGSSHGHHELACHPWCLVATGDVAKRDVRPVFPSWEPSSQMVWQRYHSEGAFTRSRIQQNSSLKYRFAAFQTADLRANGSELCCNHALECRWTALGARCQSSHDVVAASWYATFTGSLGQVLNAGTQVLGLERGNFRAVDSDLQPYFYIVTAGT